jgi:hypothetical protein
MQEKKKKKNPGINPGIWVWKNIHAYTANPPEKGKKNPGPDPGFRSSTFRT